MSVKIPILAIIFENDTPLEYVNNWFENHKDFTNKYRHQGYIYSQKKSYYESPLQITIQQNPKIMATLNIKKQEVRLEKCKPRGSKIHLGRPRKALQNTEIEIENENSNAKSETSFQNDN